MDIHSNAVLGDQGLIDGLKSVNPIFGDFCARVAGEAWGEPLVSQKTKAFMAIVLDVDNQSYEGQGTPFEAHVIMAIKQGATFDEIEEILKWSCVYCGFNKAAGGFGRLNEIKKDFLKKKNNIQLNQ
jgi:4-carboxymuconolactone decarboxylase